MKITLTLTLLFFLSFNLNSQVQVQNLGNGAYQYTSNLEDSDLHFYLFGDGHHSFELSPDHQYPSYANPADVKFYHTDPYGPEEPEEVLLHVVDNGIVNPSTEQYVFDNKISLKKSWNLVNKQNDYYILMFENLESESPISGCVEFHYLSDHLYINPNNILDDYGNNWVTNRELENSQFDGYDKKFIWNYSNLEFAEQRFIYIPINCSAESMTQVITRAVMSTNLDCEVEEPWDRNNDGALPSITDSPYYTLRSMVRNNPHDPNCIIATPNCLSDKDEIFVERYRVYFQNEGTDPAINIRLDYLIQAPIYNVTLIDASHTCELFANIAPISQVPTNGQIRIEFDSIYLRGLNEIPSPRYDQTIGWVEFDVCYNLALFTQMGLKCAESTVDIYFDFEPPVRAENTVCRGAGHCTQVTFDASIYPIFKCSQYFLPHQSLKRINKAGGDKDALLYPVFETKDEDFNIVPNPGLEYISINGNFDDSSKLFISNTNGQIIRELNKYEVSRINISELQSGVYFISIITNEKVNTKPFVKL